MLAIRLIPSYFVASDDIVNVVDTIDFLFELWVKELRKYLKSVFLSVMKAD